MRPRGWLLGALIFVGLMALALPARPSSSSTRPFGDGALHDIAGVLGAATAEPTVLVSPDGRGIEVWLTATFAYSGTHIVHGVSTDGRTFGSWQTTTVPAGYLRSHILRAGGTDLLYAAGAGDTTLHLFSGTDGVHFRDRGQVLGRGAPGAWDGAHVANSFVWREGRRWLMLYEGSGVRSSWWIGLATAPGPAGPWTREGGNPVLGTATGGGNPELARLGSTALRRSGRYVVYFHNISPSGTALYRATSTDLRHWTIEGRAAGVRYSVAPLWNGARGWSYGDQCLVQFRGHSYLFYSPSNQVDRSWIEGAIDRRPLRTLLAAPAA